MAKSASLKFNSSRASQDNPIILWDWKVYDRVNNSSPISLSRVAQAQSHIPSISLRSILILFSHLCLVLPNSLLFLFFPAQALNAFQKKLKSCVISGVRALESKQNVVFWEETLCSAVEIHQYFGPNFTAWNFRAFYFLFISCRKLYFVVSTCLVLVGSICPVL